jgi:hypothetical protein
MYVDDDEEEARAMNLKNEILAGESYLLGFRLTLNEDRNIWGWTFGNAGRWMHSSQTMFQKSARRTAGIRKRKANDDADET